MTSIGPQTIILADAGWSNKREVRVGNVSANWQINGIGRLSALVPIREAWRQGIDDYTDLELYWKHPTMGVWAGVVKMTRVRSGETLELSARSLVRKLRKSRVNRTYSQRRGSAGALVFRALQDGNGERPLFDQIRVDDAGPLISVDWRADDRFTVVDRLAKASGQQYRVDLNDDWTSTFQFRQRVGEEKQGEILLAEGYNVADVEIVTNADDIENDILAVSADDDWADAAFTYVRDGKSIRDRGRQQGTRRYYGLNSPGALAERALVELKQYRTPTIAVTLTMSARSPLLAEIREGDRVRLWSTSANGRYLFDIERRALNDASGVVYLYGTAEAA
jgi:hypothetical protein